MTRLLRPAALAAALALAAGCGGGPTLVEVDGRVTDRAGKGMPNVLVQFSPVETGGGKVRTSSAVTDADGRFVLQADGGGAGAVPGKHKVVLIDNALGGEGEPTGKAGPKPPASRIPTAYLSPTSTPLEVTVEPGKKSYDLQVK